MERGGERGRETERDGEDVKKIELHVGLYLKIHVGADNRISYSIGTAEKRM